MPRYLSLFSGIGGFEVAFHTLYGDKAICVAYCEIDKHAIQEYTRHYPHHQNLGAIENITPRKIHQLGKIDIVVGGFPCNDLSSANHAGRHGLDGQKSGLFWKMLRVLQWVKKKNPHVHIIIENNASMAHRWRDMITFELSAVFQKPVYCHHFDSMQWVLQRRRRYFWTLQKIPAYNGRRIVYQSLHDILIPTQEAKKHIISDKIIDYLNQTPAHLRGKHGFIIEREDEKNGFHKTYVAYPTRVHGRTSSTKDGYVKSIDTTLQYLLDYRLCRGKDAFIPRYITKPELARLFGYPENYIETEHTSIYARLYGMTVVPPVIRHILTHIFGSAFENDISKL